MAEAKAKGSFWARLLIILYGLGIVAIGAHPLQKQYGGVFAFLERESAAFAGVFQQSETQRAGRGLLEEPPITRSLNASQQGLTTDSKLESPNRPIDGLTTTDRKQLDKLINNL